MQGSRPNWLPGHWEPVSTDGQSAPADRYIDTVMLCKCCLLRWHMPNLCSAGACPHLWQHNSGEKIIFERTHVMSDR